MNTIYAHQQEVYEALLRTAKAFFETNWKCLPYTPRWNRLILGPSGNGKTALVKILAEELGIALYHISATNWIPLGGAERGACNTWPEIAKFILEQERVILFIDELDKLYAESSWMNHVRVEIFSLLDHKLPGNLDLSKVVSESDEDDTKALAGRIKKHLRESVFIVGAGAFQDLYETTRRERQVTGFGIRQEKDESPLLQHKDIQKVLPTEICNRFAYPLLELPMLEEKDYNALIEQVALTLPAEASEELRTLAKAQLQNAIDNKLNCRFIESLIRQLIEKRPECFQKSQPVGEYTIDNANVSLNFIGASGKSPAFFMSEGKSKSFLEKILNDDEELLNNIDFSTISDEGDSEDDSSEKVTVVEDDDSEYIESSIDNLVEEENEELADNKGLSGISDKGDSEDDSAKEKNVVDGEYSVTVHGKTITFLCKSKRSNA